MSSGETRILTKYWKFQEYDSVTKKPGGYFVGKKIGKNKFRLGNKKEKLASSRIEELEIIRLYNVDEYNISTHQVLYIDNRNSSGASFPSINLIRPYALPGVVLYFEEIPLLPSGPDEPGIYKGFQLNLSSGVTGSNDDILKINNVPFTGSKFFNNINSENPLVIESIEIYQSGGDSYDPPRYEWHSITIDNYSKQFSSDTTSRLSSLSQVSMMASTDEINNMYGSNAASVVNTFVTNVDSVTGAESIGGGGVEEVLTTKGGLLTNDGVASYELKSNLMNGHVLTIDTSATAGLKWAPLSGASVVGASNTGSGYGLYNTNDNGVLVFSSFTGSENIDVGVLDSMTYNIGLKPDISVDSLEVSGSASLNSVTMSSLTVSGGDVIFGNNLTLFNNSNPISFPTGPRSAGDLMFVSESDTSKLEWKQLPEIPEKFIQLKDISSPYQLQLTDRIVKITGPSTEIILPDTQSTSNAYWITLFNCTSGPATGLNIVATGSDIISDNYPFTGSFILPEYSHTTVVNFRNEWRTV